MKSNYHSGSQTFRCQAKKIEAEDPELGLRCMYCVQVYDEELAGGADEADLNDPPDWSGKGGIDKLFDHVEKSTTASTSDRHEELKAADGWFTDDFYELVSEDKKRARAARAAKRYEAAGLGRFERDPELPRPIPHETIPGLQYGYFDGPTYPIPDHLRDLITVGQVPTDAEFDGYVDWAVNRYPDYIARGSPTPSDVPARMTDYLVMGPAPEPPRKKRQTEGAPAVDAVEGIEEMTDVEPTT